MKGYSLHIGVNTVNEKVYGDLQTLKAAVNDAKWWEAFAIKHRYSTQKLTDKQATSDKVLKQLKLYADTMIAGDIMLLTYSGHGGQIPNDKPTSVDKESMDQTWCLYDRQLLDDELYDAFKAFKEGTRILIVSDSCHSGTVTRDIKSLKSLPSIDLSETLVNGIEQAAVTRGFASRKLDAKIQQKIITRDYEKVYQPILDKYQSISKRKDIKAAVKLLAACQDNQSTYDGDKYGLFTETLSKILTKKGESLNASEIIGRIKKYYAYPHPNYFEYGAIIKCFDTEFPFRIKLKDVAITGYLAPKQTSIKDVIINKDVVSGTINKNAILLAEFKNEVPNFNEGDEVKVIKKVGNTVTLEVKGMQFEHGWTAAHALQTRLKQLGHDVVIEPILSYNPSDDKALTRASSGDANYIDEWSPAREKPAVKIGWHLDDAHSQLASAAKKVMDKPNRHITVGHIDTGYLPGHVGLPKNLQTSKERNFMSGEGEVSNKALDKVSSGNDGHGLGTICLFAGNDVPNSSTAGEFSGYIGGVPFADVIPMRISDSVAILNSENFCEAIDYALAQGCEVVTMSMAGKPSPRMARAINRAYEGGLVVVSAASNCWYDGFPKTLLPKCVLYPAAFKRVIAATGAMYNHQPYDSKFRYPTKGDFTKYMQGSWGPAESMTRALAAYTPNTPWAEPGNKFVKSGGGTSSATPQVAAAAALWIAYHREELESKGYYKPGHQWKKVEAVRYALYTSAAKGSVFAEWKKYYGNGILRALDALNVAVPDASKLTQSPDAESSFGGVFQLIGSFFKNRKLFRDAKTIKPSEDQLALEFLQLLQTDSSFNKEFSRINVTNKMKMGKLINDPKTKEKVLQSPFASPYLKEAFMK